MAFGLDTGPFLIQEGTWYVGTWTDPDTIGNGSVGDPAALFTGDPIGWFKQGTTTINLNRTYAEAKGLTPSVKLRKDLIEKTFMFNLQLFQYSADTMELFMGLYTQAGYSAAGFTGNLMWVGPWEDNCVGDFRGYLLRTQTTDCVPLNIAVWYGKVTTEDTTITLAGTDYATMPVKVEAFMSPAFTTSAADLQKSYGMIWQDNS